MKPISIPMALLVVSLAGLLAGAIVVAVRAWRAVETDMHWHGWLAMGLGAVLTIAVAAGLMGLVFYSSRAGWDDIDREV